METRSAARAWDAQAESWTRQVRAGRDVYRDALNTPAFLAFLPRVAGLEGLDVGCGEGANTRALARSGARMLAIDVAPTFVRHASETEAGDPLGIRYAVADAAALPFPDERFGFATAFMSLMDIPDMDRALREIARVLQPGGFLQFSILHPCFAPPHRRVLREADGTVRAVEVARYFERTDGPTVPWWFSTVPKADRMSVAPFAQHHHHRTLSDWIAMVVSADLAIEAMGEPRADPALAQAVPVVPLFLHVRARKAGRSASVRAPHGLDPRPRMASPCHEIA